MTAPHRQLAGGNRTRGALGLLLSGHRPNTGDNQPQFTAKPPPQASRSSTDSSKQHVALWLLPGSLRRVTGKAEIDEHGNLSEETPKKTTQRPASDHTRALPG